jgi:parallel beta-helix repeat protein
MTQQNNTSPLYNITWYTDAQGRKISIQRQNEIYKVVNNKITLSDLPDSYYKLQITGMTEVSLSSQISSASQFKVNYDTGEVFFDPSKEGSTIIIASYYGRGRVNLYAQNISLLNKNSLYTSTNVEDFSAEIFNKATTIDTRVSNIVSNAGSSNTEIVDARYDSINNITYPTLKGRIDSNSSQLGILSNLQVIDKSSIVNAINENVNRRKEVALNVKDFGVKGDGVTDDATALQTAINAVPSGGKLIIPRGLTVKCGSTITISTPMTVDAYGATLVSSHNSQNVLVINSNDVTINGFTIQGNNGTNENAIQIKTGKTNIEINEVITSGALNGISSEVRVKNVRINKCTPQGQVQGIILRTPYRCFIEKCRIDNHSVNGGNAIKIQGYQLNVISMTVSNSTITATNHGFVVGDKIRFQLPDTSTPNPTLPNEIKLDKSYYVSSVIDANTFKVSSTPTGADVTFTGSDFSGNVIVLVTARDIRIRDNDMFNNRAGIYCTYTDDSIFEGNYIDGGTCIQLENSWHNKVSLNTTINASDLGINLHRNSSYNKIIGNKAAYCTNAGIGLTQDIVNGQANNNYNEIIGNTSEYSIHHPNYPTTTGSGIEMTYLGKGNTIKGNHLLNNEKYGVHVGGGLTMTIITENHIEGNSIGIMIDNDNATVGNNFIMNNGSDGIHLSNAVSWVNISNNKINKNLGWGIYLDNNSQFCTGTGNQVWQNNSGHIHMPTNYTNSKFDTNQNIFNL